MALVGIALIPVPLRIIAPGSLQPRLQYLHYAPLDARVVKVHVDYGDPVAAGQVLLELEDRNLSNLLDEASSQHLKSKERQRDIEARLLRSDRLSSDVRDDLEGELESLRALSGSELQRIEALKKQMDLLIIRAAEGGVVATWNARQLLQERPVRAGQMLLLVQQPEGPWTIEARLPQREVGKFLTTVDRGMPTAQITLASHPNQPIRAVYQPNDKPVVLSNSQDIDQPPSLYVRFAVAATELPHKNAGSSAQISIDTGRGALAWSVFGDAVMSLWAKVRLWI
jgi:multidrug efflux pump subunit AcrA (membrane-fusion protein)